MTNADKIVVGAELRVTIEGECRRIQILGFDVDGDPEFTYLDGPDAGDDGVCCREDLAAAIRA